MERTTIIGIVAGLGCIAISIMMSGNIVSFLDLPSVFIVFGGVIASTVVSYPGKTLKSLKIVFQNAFIAKKIDLNDDIDLIIRIANIARREGLLALEDSLSDIDNPFLQKGVMLIVDGADAELVKNVMETEIAFIEDRHGQGQAVVLSMSSYSPAYGMIGTLIGLINMLKELDNMDSLAPNMAVALVTTFYGVVLANLVFTPIAKKLKVHSDMESLQKELYLEGLLSIQDGENPRIIKDKLTAFIARRDQRRDAEDKTNPEVKEL